MFCFALSNRGLLVRTERPARAHRLIVFLTTTWSWITKFFSSQQNKPHYVSLLRQQRFRGQIHNADEYTVTPCCCLSPCFLPAVSPVFFASVLKEHRCRLHKTRLVCLVSWVMPDLHIQSLKFNTTAHPLVTPAKPHGHHHNLDSFLWDPRCPVCACKQSFASSLFWSTSFNISHMQTDEQNNKQDSWRKWLSACCLHVFLSNNIKLSKFLSIWMEF